jgi:hypothetical protein
VDKDTGRRRFRISIGPLGMSLAAAAVTAIAFAAVSLADNGAGNGSESSAKTFQAPAPPGGGVGITMFRGDLSAADRQKMDDFRQCMQDNGAPGPPEPGQFDPSNPPKPPTAADKENLLKAWEACKDKLPEDMQKAGPPQLHAGNCAPPPGAPAPGDSGKNQNHDQSNDSSGSSSGSNS